MSNYKGGTKGAVKMGTTNLDRRKSNPFAGGVGEWADESACLDRDPETFFAHGYTREGTPRWHRLVWEAKSICADCPVTRDCLQLALKNEGTLAAKSRAGIYGGYTEHERVLMVKDAE